MKENYFKNKKEEDFFYKYPNGLFWRISKDCLEK